MRDLAFLVKSDLYKEFKKKRTILVSVGVLLVLIAMPIFMSLMKDSPDYNYNEAYYNREIDSAQKNIDKLSGDNGVSASIERAYQETLLDFYSFGLQQRIYGYGDWRFQFYSGLRDSLMQLKGLQLFNNGYKEEDILQYFSFDSEFFEDTENLTEKLLESQNAVDELKQKIEENDYTPVLTDQISAVKTSLGEAELTLEGLKQRYTLDPTLKGEISVAESEAQVDVLREQLSILEYRLDAGIGQENEDDRYLITQQMISGLNDKHYPLLSEEAFEYSKQNGKFDKNITYSIYRDGLLNSKILASNTIEEYRYCLENDLPVSEVVADGRSAATVAYSAQVLISIYMIYLCVSMMGGEYQKKTLRGMLVSKWSRSAVFFSKVSAAALVAIFLTVITVFASILTAGISYNFSDFLIPIAKATTDGVVEVSFFSVYFGNIFACFTSTILISSVALALCVLCRGILLPAILTPLIFFGSSYLVGIAANQGWQALAFSPLPYLNLSDLVGGSAYMTGLLIRGFNVNITYGVILSWGIIPLILLSTFWLFKNRRRAL